MSTTEREERDLAGLRETADVSEKALRDLVAKLCPGVHQPAQHRDHKPPWCDSCRRTARGLLVRE